MSLFFLLAAGSLPTLITGAPLPSTLLARANDFITHLTDRRSAGFGDVYTQYSGSGEQGWPQMSNWVDFDTLFAKNTAVISQSCTQFGAANPSTSEISDIKSGIQTVAAESGVDERFIFAIMMQESNGCVRAPTTNYGVRNPGLMQDHNGAASCNEASQTNPCPASTITQMIRDGTEGTSSGDGLKQCMAQADASGAASYYRAARIYNSGSISGDNLSGGVATHCYSSDVANRLTGWVHGLHACNLDGASVAVNTVMPTGASPATSSAAAATTTQAPPAPVTTEAPAPTTTSTSTPPPPPAPTTTSTPTTTSIPPAAPTTTSTPTTTPHAASSKPAFTWDSAPAALPTISIPNGDHNPKAEVSQAPAKPTTTTVAALAAATTTSTTAATATKTTTAVITVTATTAAATTAAAAEPAAPAATKAPGVTDNCSQYYTVATDDNCWSLGQTYGFTFAQFQSWNTQIDGACSNLWKGYSYCVKQ